MDFSIADLLSFALFALKESLLLIRTFVLLGVYTVTFLHTEIWSFWLCIIALFKLLFSFQSNCKALLPVPNTIFPSQVNCYEMWEVYYFIKHFYGLDDNLFGNWHAAKEPDLGHFKTWRLSSVKLFSYALVIINWQFDRDPQFFRTYSTYRGIIVSYLKFIILDQNNRKRKKKAKVMSQYLNCYGFWFFGL